MCCTSRHYSLVLSSWVPSTYSGNPCLSRQSSPGHSRGAMVHSSFHTGFYLSVIQLTTFKLGRTVNDYVTKQFLTALALVRSVRIYVWSNNKRDRYLKCFYLLLSNLCLSSHLWVFFDELSAFEAKASLLHNLIDVRDLQTGRVNLSRSSHC